MSVTREDLKSLHHDLTEKSYKVMTVKNADYAKDTDPLRNFRMFEEFGIVVRLSDKVARLRTFCERGVLDVKDESVEDTLVDIINYSVLFAAYIQDRKPTLPVNKPIQITDGPYCNCGQLADFRNDNVIDPVYQFMCSNCAAEFELDTTDWTLLGRL